MKKGLRGKFQNKKGFTLVEMLIVVAIIAILIAVSIPLVSTSLEKARQAVDDANERSALALGNIYYLTSDSDTDDFTTGVTMYYKVGGDSHEGVLKSETTAPTAGTTEGYGYGQSKDHKNDYVILTIKEGTSDDAPVVTVKWSKDGSTP